METKYEGTDLIRERNELVLMAVKERMLNLASRETRDQVLLSDLAEMIDAIHSGFIQTHANKRLDIGNVHSYAMLNFKDIAGGFGEYFEQVTCSFGPVKRFFLLIPLAIASRRISKIVDLAGRISNGF